METATWILSFLWSAVGVFGTLVWFLISGWVSTLMQIAVVIVAIYGLKYG